MINRQFIRFLLVGLANTAIGYTAILLAHYAFSLNAFAANFLGYLAGGIVGYHLNRTFTFSSSRLHSETIPRYTFALISCFLLNLATLKLFIQVVSFPIAQALAVGTYTVAFYLISRLIVFRD